MRTRARSAGSLSGTGEGPGMSNPVSQSNIIPPRMPDRVTAFHSTSGTPIHTSVVDYPPQTQSSPLIAKPEVASMAAKEIELRERELAVRERELELERDRLRFERASLMQTLSGVQSETQNVGKVGQGAGLPPSGASLPRLEIQSFDGSPLEFWSFRQSFEDNIASQIANPATKLAYLVQYCKGGARTAIKGCTGLNPDTAYAEAWKRLENHFGQTHRLVHAVLSNILDGRQLTGDLSGMRTFSDSLKECSSTLSQVGKADELDHTSNMVKLMSRLPTGLQSEWARHAGRIRIKGREANCNDLIEFIEQHIATLDNVYGMAISNANRAAQPRSTTNNQHHRVFNTVIDSLPSCSWCGAKNHGLGGCGGFAAAAVSERRDFIRRSRRCFVCLGSRHFANDCKSNVRCTVNQCNGRHHSLLHSAPPKPMVAVTNASTVSGKIRLGFVPVVVQGSLGEASTYALLDTGSDVTLVTERLAKVLGLEGDRCVLNIRTVNGTQNASSKRVKLNLGSLDQEFHVSVDGAYIVNKLPCQRVDRPFDMSKWQHLKDVTMDSLKHDEVEMLIGCDVSEAHWVLDQRMGGLKEPHAVKTPFGWMVRGNVGEGTSDSRVLFTSIGEQSMDEHLERLYECEYRWTQDDDTDAPSKNDQRALAVVETSIRLEGGRYEVAVPWKKGVPTLPNNLSMAKHRAELLRRRLLRNGEMLSTYVATIRTHEAKGYISRAGPGRDTMRWYLPHHPVVNPKKPGKVRIVFDCAAKFMAVSLNDELLSGPNLNNDLTGVLLRFREGPVASSADIEEMFLRVKLPDKDKWAFSFLWWDNEGLKGEPVVYQWNVHPFGATSSPFCAAYALRKLAMEGVHSKQERWEKAVLDNFYVDDCLLASESIEEAAITAQKLTENLARVGFRLTKWVSNKAEALRMIPAGERLPEDENKELVPSQPHHALGVLWDKREDTLRINWNVTAKPNTKRGVLSVVASFFDPLGIVGPLLLPGRNFLQRLCRQGLGWDTPISQADEKWWVEWLGGLAKLPKLEVPRYVLGQNSASVNLELHVFSDASEMGYGVVAYVRSENPTEGRACRFILGKSRVIPSKPVTVPRLELTAAVLAVKLKNFIMKESRLNIREVYMWTDSELVLCYLNNTTNRFKMFVANRVTFILEHSAVAQWRHVPTQSNPADLASRGTTKASPAEVELWLKGPAFLMSEKSYWPRTALGRKNLEEDFEVKRVATTVGKPLDNPVLSSLLLRYSTWTKMVRGTAWLKRFVQYMVVMFSKRAGVTLRVGQLSLEEQTDAERDIVKMVQRQCFPAEYEALLEGSRKKMSLTLSGLKPVISDGLLCLGGRVSSGLILLPNKHIVTDMVIRHYHIIGAHVGSTHVLAEIRRKFWIVKGMASVRRVLKLCLHCRAATARPCGQEMATLPAVRVDVGVNPFSVCGVDYFGPFEVKYGRVTLKRYGCLFTCLKTRAVHLEIAHHLSTDSFLMALIRFIGRRGVPESMHSDNGSNFVGAEAELRRQLDKLDQSRISRVATHRGIAWQFNPPNASHRGGVWERMIRTTRRVLTAVAGHQRLTDESLSTFLVEAERLVNNRPITPVYDDPDQPSVLRPNDLLLLRPNDGIPTAEVTLVERYTKAWRQAQYLASVFWKRWVREYLPTLQSRNKWHKREREVGVGDLVLVISGTAPYGSWPKGVVSEVMVGHDGHVRDVKIRTSNGVVIRDIRSVCLLEAAFEESH